jgi:hypothetical protein
MFVPGALGCEMFPASPSPAGHNDGCVQWRFPRAPKQSELRATPVRRESGSSTQKRFCHDRPAQSRLGRFLRWQKPGAVQIWLRPERGGVSTRFTSRQARASRGSSLMGHTGPASILSGRHLPDKTRLAQQVGATADRSRRRESHNLVLRRSGSRLGQ